MPVKKGAKLVGYAGIAVLGVLGFRYAGEHGWIPTPGIMKALVPTKVADVPKVEDAKVANVKPLAFPSTDSAHVSATLIRGEIWEWNADLGLIYANGGADTTKGSLMEKNGVNLHLGVQNDTTKMGEDVLACAKEIKDGASQCSNGANFVVIMGNGAGNFAAGLNPQLKKLGPDYQLKVIAGLGYSRGEDACMAAPEVKTHPEQAKGQLWEAVPRDGDQHLCLVWAAANNIKVNPDPTTYDPDAINFRETPDYTVAASDYVSGVCDDRKVVKDGHPTGQTKHICVTGAATWTPGDVTVADKKGGLVKIASTKEYSSLMPAVLIGPAKFFRDNRDEFQNLILASSQGADQINAYDSALRYATKIEASLYNDKDANADYWYKYFHGVTKQDSQGLRVSLGGSAVSNLADNQTLFGLRTGVNDNFRSVYQNFADIILPLYPAFYKQSPMPDVKDIEDKSFVEGAAAGASNTGAAAETENYGAGESGPVVGNRDYSIQFDTGRASLTPAGLQTMRQIKDSLATSALFISITGYTDNTGNEQANLALSRARAETVKNYLEHAAPSNFPDNRFSVEGKGSEDPVASNDTAEGKAANRRVHIVLSGSGE